METRPEVPPPGEDYFGYLGRHHLGEPGTLSFSLGTIQPIAEYSEVAKEVESSCNTDGYFYPPQIYTARQPLGGGALERIPQTERPAAMYHAPVTHKISFLTANAADHRRGVSGFLVHLLGFISGHHAQFYDWWVAGRIPVKSQEPFVVHPRHVQALVSTAETTWLRADEAKQRHLTNILYCWGRLFSYEWLWEEFAFRYMLADSIWRFHHVSDGMTRHGDRLRVLCDELDLQYDEPAAGAITHLRNKLFHESVWAGDTPGYGGTDDQFMANLNLRSLVNQFIARTLGFSKPLARWTAAGMIGLDPN
jgi:hypothetical protein